MPVDPIIAINDALSVLNGILRIIASLKSQGGLSDEQIMLAAQNQVGANREQIKQLLANLPTE